MSRGSLIPLEFLLYTPNDLKPPLIHYGLAPFKISTAPFKMLMRNFEGPGFIIYY